MHQRSSKDEIILPLQSLSGLVGVLNEGLRLMARHHPTHPHKAFLSSVKILVETFLFTKIM